MRDSSMPGHSEQALAVVAASRQRYVLEARRMVQDPEQSEPQETQTDGLPRASWAIWLRRAVLVLVAIAVAATLWKIGRGYGAHQIELYWSPVIAATLILVATNLMQAMAWARLLNRMSHRKLAIPPILAGFMAGQLARYLPTGKVALLVVRTAAIRPLGLPARLVASSIGIEVLSWLTTGMLIGTGALYVTGRHGLGLARLLSSWSLPVAACSVFAILVLVSVDRRHFPQWSLRLIHAEGAGPLLSLRVLGWQAGSALGPLLQGALLPFAVGASADDVWPTVGMFLLAPIAGFLAVVAPGGLGVREAVLSVAISADLGTSRAVVVALLARATFVISEVISWGLAKWLVHAKATRT